MREQFCLVPLKSMHTSKAMMSDEHSLHHPQNGSSFISRAVEREDWKQPKMPPLGLEN